MDAPESDALRSRVDAALSHDGVRVRFGARNDLARTYALVEGPEGVDPLELQSRLPDARWYDEAIIVLAIEPQPQDALPFLAQALGGHGAPSGMCAADRAGKVIVLEFRPSVTRAAVVLRLADVELARFNGCRQTQLLAPLAAETIALIAAEGLQAPEIAPDRILESLLEAARVE
jgi:hypothetical protein